MADLLHLPDDAAAFRALFSRGEAFLYPTEAVYGLGCDPSNPAAIERLIALKNRPAEKGLIMIAGSWTQCAGWIADTITARDREAMDAIGRERPTTFILPKGSKIAALAADSATGRVALRITAHPLAAALCEIAGQPIISTSANPAGEAPALTLKDAQSYFPAIAAIAGDLGSAHAPSRIMDWQTRQFLRN